MKSMVLVLMSVLIQTSFAQAQTKQTSVYSLSNPSKTGITFKIGFSAGVHDGDVDAMENKVVLDKKNNILSGDFKILIDHISTGNSTRDCHMREALGIKYEGSQFPNEHVCDSDDKLPASGPDAASYQAISFSFTSVKANSNSLLPETLEVGKVYNLAVQGKFTMHGRTKDFSAVNSTEFIPVQVKLINAETQELQLASKFEVSLSEFGVVVKPFKLGPFKIGVSDKAKVSLDMKLSLQK